MAKRAQPRPVITTSPETDAKTEAKADPAPVPAKPAPAKPVTAPRRREIAAAPSANAPFLYFDTVSNFGVNNGVVNMTLEAIRYIAPDQEVITDRILVAHLRMSIAAAKAMKLSLEKALLMAAPVPNDQRN